MKFPGEMTPAEFFALPVNASMVPGLQELRNASHPTGFVDSTGQAWRWVSLDDGTYARERLG